MLSVGLVQSTADLLVQALELALGLIDPSIHRLFLELDEQGQLPAEELDQLDDLDEQLVDDGVVEVFKGTLIPVLIHDLVLLTAVLLRVPE